jgi:ParB family chromosome partitioning protein
MTGQLVKYDAACRALAAAKNVDEIKDIRDKAVAIQAYARVAKNRQMEIDASEIRIRAERRLGEMLKPAPKATGTRGQGRPPKGGSKTHPPKIAPPTLADMGIDKKLADRSRKLARLPEPDFEEKVADWKGRVAREEDRVRVDLLAPKVHVDHYSGDIEWYTPKEYIKAIHSVMGGIDLDPASTPEANEVVKATQFFTEKDNGLKQIWRGRIFLNPPYATGLVEQFTGHLVNAMLAGAVKEACVLLNNATETRWFQHLLSGANAVCFPRGRVKFWHPHKKTTSTLQGQAVIYFGPHQDRFVASFKPFGVVCHVLL